nr:matrixin family metalloprotease [Cellulomonas sp. APG4]
MLPVVPVTSSGAHEFLHTTDDGLPVGYDPCRPVRYVVRPDGAPPEGDRLLADALAVVSAATGLAFEHVGTTDEEPVKDRDLIQPGRYGDGWVPVLVAWSDEDELPELAGQVAGVGGSAAVPGSDGRGRWLAAGRLVLDAPDLVALLERPDGEAQARAVVVHELGHVLGLDHVDDTAELMHPQTSARAELGPGDRQGLALLGAVACE